MAATTTYDVLIIGAGQAAFPLSFDLAKAGKTVAIVERTHLGGSCVNFGCTPTKAVVASARVAHLARRGDAFGLRIPTVDVDFPAVLAAARAIVAESRDGLQEDLDKAGGNPALLRGQARLDGRDGDAFRVRVGGDRASEDVVHARQVVLDTGTRSVIPDLPGLAGVDCIHAGNWLDRPELPSHLAILGAGYIGLEMGQFYRRMGSRVTIFEQGGQIAAREDPDVAQALQKLLEAEGVTFYRNVEVTEVTRRDGGVRLHVQHDGETRTHEASHLFVAVGRKPNTDDLGLETVGVAPDKHGIVPVDERLATSVAGLWVAGDIRGGPQFTHTSWDDYRVLQSQLAGDGARLACRLVPYAIFTDPQLGRVGMTETEAKAAGKVYKVGRFQMCHNGRARTFRTTDGFIKVLVDPKSDRLLGAAVLADEAAELVHIYVNLMNADAPYTQIRDAVFIHPTLAEGVQAAMEAVA